MNAYRMKNSLGCDIKCPSSSTSSIDPVNNSLSVGILIVVHFTICVAERIPILTHSKVRFTCIQVILDITTPKSSNKIQPPSIITNFISTCHEMPAKYYINKLLQLKYVFWRNSQEVNLPHHVEVHRQN